MLLGVFLVSPFSAPHEEHSSLLAKHHFDALKRYAGAPKRSPRAPIARATSGTSCGRRAGCQRPNIERMVRPIRFGGSIERMVYDEFWGCGRADCGLSCSPATRCGLRRRGPHSNRYRAGKGRRKAAAGEGAISRHADVGAQCTQRHSGRSRARGSLCKGLFCVRDDLAEIAAIKG